MQRFCPFTLAAPAFMPQGFLRRRLHDDFTHMHDAFMTLQMRAVIRIRRDTRRCLHADVRYFFEALLMNMREYRTPSMAARRAWPPPPLRAYMRTLITDVMLAPCRYFLMSDDDTLLHYALSVQQMIFHFAAY